MSTMISRHVHSGSDALATHIAAYTHEHMTLGGWPMTITEAKPSELKMTRHVLRRHRRALEWGVGRSNERLP